MRVCGRTLCGSDVPFDGYTAVTVRTDRQYVDTVDKYPKVRIRGQNPRTRLTPTSVPARLRILWEIHLLYAIRSCHSSAQAASLSHTTCKSQEE